MRSRLFSQMLLTLFLLSTITLAFSIHQVGSEPGTNGSWAWVRDTITGAWGEAVVGTGDALYAAKKSSFYRYRPADNSWTVLAALPNPDAGDAFKTGTALAWDFGNYIYALYGAATADSRRWFYRYSISGNSWEDLASTPYDQGEGDAITWVGLDNLIYATIGGEQRATYFLRYDPSTNTWSDAEVADPPAGMGDGASLVWTGGEFLYALRGEFYEESPTYDFWRYNITSDIWTAMADIPAYSHDDGVGGVGDGGSLLYVGLWLSNQTDFIYALSGNQAYPESPEPIPDNRFYRYTISTDSWEHLADLPFGVGYYVGSRLGYAAGHIYAWQGTPSTWTRGGDDLARYDFPLVPKTDWPMFQHDQQHTGYTSESVYLPLTLAWKYETDYGYFVGSPVVTNGILYVKDDGGILHAFDAENGTLKWEKNVGGGGESTPAVSEGILYVTGSDLYAFDAITGDLKWTCSEAGFAQTSSPVVVDGIVYFADSYNVYAVNVTTGTLVWKCETAQFQMDYPYPSPAIGNGMLYVGEGDGKLYAINVSTGALKWIFTTYAALKGSPTIYEKTVYFAGADSYFYALDANTGGLKWKSFIGYLAVSTPAVHNNTIYIAVSQGTIYAFNAETGALRWSKSFGYYTWGSVVIAYDRLYIGPYVIDANTAELLFEADVEGGISSSAAVANGMVYILSSRGTGRPAAYGVIYAFSGANDVIAPSTSHDYDGLWHNTDFTITLTANDDLSGVAETYYKINDGPTKTVTTDGQPRITTESSYNKLEYWSVDNAGNEELPHKILTGIELDKTIPTANAGVDQTVNEDAEVPFDGSASTDENGIASYTWTFTDETTKTLIGEKPTYIFNTPAVYTVTLNVTDAAGNWATDTVVITVLDITNPVANAGQNQTVNVGETVNFDASASSDNVGIVSYEWDFGDGTTGAGKTTTHTYADPKTYTVTLTVNDAAGNTANHTITVTALSPSTEAFPIWIIGATVAAIAIAVTATLLLRKRK